MVPATSLSDLLLPEDGLHQRYRPHGSTLPCIRHWHSLAHSLSLIARPRYASCDDVPLHAGLIPSSLSQVP